MIQGATRFAFVPVLVLWAVALCPSGCARVGDDSRPGKLTLESPTLHCLGVRWIVHGDADRDATVGVLYRKAGTLAWKRAMGLFRVQTEALQGVAAPPGGAWLFAGSVFGLEEDTEYELRLTLVDPDGGKESRTLKARTWREPRAPAPLRVLHVAPGTGAGSGTEEAPLRGIAAADRGARPGDLILVHGGIYPGPIAFTRSGTSEAPIVWRGAGDGEAIFERPDGKCCVRADRLRHVFFEELAFRKAERALTLQDSRYVTVRGCRFYDIGSGIGAAGYQERLFIADCVFLGRRTWPRPRSDEFLGEHRGVELSGIGHVIAYNRISGFRDGVDTRPGLRVRSIDIHNNDISECTDDAIELDFSESNCRAYENRITNCFVGVSFQPSRGGPNYAVRNAMYNLKHETWKLHVTPPEPGVYTSGGVILHNTVVRQGVPFLVHAPSAPVHHYFMRNNLYVVREAERVIDMQCKVDYADWDHNIYAGGPFEIFGKWHGVFYGTREAFAKATGQEAHSLVLKVQTGFFASGLVPPEDFRVQFPPAINDLRLAPGSPAVDRGTRLAGINDGFRGKEPDVGAYELGDALPHYGPRPPKR